MSIRAWIATELGPLSQREPAAAWDAVAALAPAPLLARSRTTETAVVRLPDGTEVVRKRWTWPRARDRLRGAFRTTVAARSPAAREAAALRSLRALPNASFAPAPLATLEQRTGGVLGACVLLVEFVPGATDLGSFLASSTEPLRRRAVLRDLARRTAAMHTAGLEDRDLHPRNVLVVADEARTFVVDSAQQRATGAALSASRAARDLACLDVGLVRLGRGSERARFLLDYLRGTAADGRALCGLVERWRARIDEREAARLATQTPASG